MRLKHSFVIALLVLSLAILLPCVAGAQTAPAAPEGVTWGDYNVQQSVEFGYRITDDWGRGNYRTYDNFVNLHDGPRMLEQTLSMRSLSHTAPLFDNLFISSFGFGGDPNNAARFRVSKNKWYNFSGSFRRDQNFFDYPLWGNPMNPTANYVYPANAALGIVAGSVATPQLQDSAHPFAVRRRMSDFNLTLLPEAKVSVRLGYTRNRSTGPSYSSFHEGTDFILGGNGDNTNTTNNTYRIGADFKLLPKTTFSYDQTLDYYKNDTDYDLGQGFRFNTYAPTGYTSQTIDFGLPFFGAPINNPCANFFVNGSMVNPNCSGLYLVNPISGLPGYYHYQKTRTKTPSEQFSFASRAIPHVDLTGRYIYSNADLTSPFSEDFYGAVTRTQERRWGQQGTAIANAVANNAELSATIHLTDKWRVVETFRFLAWRTPTFLTANEWSQVPGLLASSNSCLAGNGPCTPGNASTTPVLPGASGFTPFLLLPIVGGYTPAQALTAANSTFGAHNSSTGADYGTTTVGAFLGQSAKWNTVQIEYDMFKTFGVRIGYRYGNKRDAVKDGFESGTEYYYPNPDTALGAPRKIGTGAAAARRGNCAAGAADVTQTIAANGVCTANIDAALSEADVFDVTEHTGLFGVWARPTRSFRFNGEVELTSADAAVTRVSPRHQQHYRLRTTWQPAPWATISATYNGIESRNPGSVVPPLPASLVINGVSTPMVPGLQPNTLDINYRGHNRNIGISTTVARSDRWGFDVSYNYNDFAQTNLVCPVYTSITQASTGYASTALPSLPVCPLFPDQILSSATSMQATVGGKIVSGENLQNGTFTSTNHFVAFSFMFKPVKKVTTQLGYSLSKNDGNMLALSPYVGVGSAVNVPANSFGQTYSAIPATYGAPGTLANAYHIPSVSISYEFVKNWTAKAAWNYYSYGEKAVANIGSNDFHTNAALLSLRYAF